MAISPKHILVIYYNNYDSYNTRITISQHLRVLDAIEDAQHTIVYYNAFDDYSSPELKEISLKTPSWVLKSHFDAIILHYSFLAFHWNEMALIRWKQLFSWIGNMDCLKVAIPQDEYDRAGLLDEWLFDWGVSVIFSCFDDERRGPLYPFTRNRAAFHHCLTGYIDHDTAQQYAKRIDPLDKRPFDIVYRARHLPFWFGSAGQLKHRIGEIIAPQAQAVGFHCDISTRAEDAILGTGWLDFLGSSRAVIGCESGSSVVDWRGEVEAQVKAILKTDAGLSFEQVSAQMPGGWDSHRFFAISPRHFEAIITKTCQLLVEGDYSGVLEPDRHYIPLKRDFSNLDEALEKLRDTRFVSDMVERAYDDIYLSGKYSYRVFARQIEEALFGQDVEKQPQPITIMKVKEKDVVENEALESLERELIAERHHAVLQEAKLLEAQQHIGELTGQLRILMGELQGQLQAQVGALQGQLQTQDDILRHLQSGAEAFREQLRTYTEALQGQLQMYAEALQKQLHMHTEHAEALQKQLHMHTEHAEALQGQLHTHTEALQKQLNTHTETLQEHFHTHTEYAETLRGQLNTHATTLQGQLNTHTEVLEEQLNTGIERVHDWFRTHAKALEQVRLQLARRRKDMAVFIGLLALGSAMISNVLILFVLWLMGKL